MTAELAAGYCGEPSVDTFLSRPWQGRRLDRYADQQDRVRPLREKLGLPLFTLDACRHGGMTDLEEAELTEGRARPAMRPARPIAVYAKATELRSLGGHQEASRVSADDGVHGRCSQGGAEGGALI
jgi:hypothetical protein